MGATAVAIALAAAALVLVAVEAQPTAYYDSYARTKAFVAPQAAGELYSRLFYADANRLDMCVLTGELQLAGGAAPGGWTRAAAANQTDGYLANSTRLWGCADQLVRSPLYSGLPSPAAAREAAVARGLYRAQDQGGERSANAPTALNSVRAQGTPVAVTLVELLYDVVGECAGQLPDVLAGRATLRGLGDVLNAGAVRTADILAFAREQVTDKDAASASFKAPLSPATTPLVVVLAPSAAAVEAVLEAAVALSCVANASVPATTCDPGAGASGPVFAARAAALATELALPLPHGAAALTRGDLLAALAALPAGATDTLVGYCAMRHIRGDAGGRLFDLVNGGLPVSAVAGIVASDTAALALQRVATSIAAASALASGSGGGSPAPSLSPAAAALVANVTAALPRMRTELQRSARTEASFWHYISAGPAAALSMAWQGSAAAVAMGDGAPTLTLGDGVTSDAIAAIGEWLFEDDGCSAAPAVTLVAGRGQTIPYLPTDRDPNPCAVGAITPDVPAAGRYDSASYFSAFAAAGDQLAALQQLGAVNRFQILDGAPLWQAPRRGGSGSGGAGALERRSLLASYDAAASPTKLASAFTAPVAHRATYTYQQRSRMNMAADAPIVALAAGDSYPEQQDAAAERRQPGESPPQPAEPEVWAAVPAPFSIGADDDGDEVGVQGPTSLHQRRTAAARKRDEARRTSVVVGASSSSSGGDDAASGSNFFSSPTCLEMPTPSCSPVGGLSAWATTAAAPDAYFNATAVPDSNATRTFTPAGSIAVVVSATSTESLFHNLIPATSTTAATMAAALLAVDTLAHTILPRYLLNATALAGAAAAKLGAAAAPAPSQEQLLASLGQLYFYFFTAEDEGFAGSGRFLKEALSFECARSPADPASASVDCNFPFYWFTNFTRIVDFSNFTHVIALDGAIDPDGQIPAQHAAEASPSANDTFTFYAYSDSRLDAASPAQALVNGVLDALDATLDRADNETATASGQTYVTTSTRTRVVRAPPGDDFLLAAASNGTATVNVTTTIPRSSLWPFLTMAFEGSVDAAPAPGPPPMWAGRSFTLLSASPPGSFTANRNARASPLNTLTELFAGGGLRAAMRAANLTGSTPSSARTAQLAGAIERRRQLTYKMLVAAGDLLASLVGSLVVADATGTQGSPALAAAPLYGRADEGQRLFYCLAVNTNCHYFASDFNLNGGRRPSAPADLAPPSYYPGTFVYYWHVNAPAQLAQLYLQDRLRISPQTRLNASFLAAAEAAVAAGEPNATELLAARGLPACAEDTFACPSRYQVCGAAPWNQTIGLCFPRQAFLAHAFSAAATYNPRMPSSASYSADWAFLNGQWLPKGTGGNATLSPPSSGASASPGALSREVLAAVAATATGIAVESYWSSTAASSLGARIAASMPATSHFLMLGGGLVWLALVVGGCVAYAFLLEPRIPSKAADDAGSSQYVQFTEVARYSEQDLAAANGTGGDAAAPTEPAPPAGAESRE